MYILHERPFQVRETEESPEEGTESSSSELSEFQEYGHQVDGAGDTVRDPLFAK